MMNVQAITTMLNLIYRNNPHERPNLCELDQRSVEKYLNLLKRKGYYMYEYMDSFDKFGETQLPPRERFFSSLNGEGGSEEDYEHAKNVWNTFSINNIKEYHNLYLLTDVLLLDDVLLAYRKMCLEYYGLDPWRFYTAPGTDVDGWIEDAWCRTGFVDG